MRFPWESYWEFLRRFLLTFFGYCFDDYFGNFLGDFCLNWLRQNMCTFKNFMIFCTLSCHKFRLKLSLNWSLWQFCRKLSWNWLWQVIYNFLQDFLWQINRKIYQEFLKIFICLLLLEVCFTISLGIQLIFTLEIGLEILNKISKLGPSELIWNRLQQLVWKCLWGFFRLDSWKSYRQFQRIVSFISWVIS